MYTIVYTKKAAADIPKLKSAKLDTKAKALIEILRENPYYTPALRKADWGSSGGLFPENQCQTSSCLRGARGSQCRKNHQPLDAVRILEYRRNA